jgi:hypothetical protein
MFFMQPVPFLGYRNIPLVATPFIGIDFIRQSLTHGIAVDISNRMREIRTSGLTRGMDCPPQLYSPSNWVFVNINCFLVFYSEIFLIYQFVEQNVLFQCL